MHFWFLLVTSAIPVVKVCLLALVGAAMAHLGVLDTKGRHALSRVTFSVFIPSLTFSKLAASVDLRNIGRWWYLPVNIVLSLSMGVAIGWVIARLLRVPKRLQPHIICTTASGNVGNLPMVLVAALCTSQSTPAVIASAVAPGQCMELGIAYVVFAMWVAGLFQFSIVNFLLKRPAEEAAQQQQALPTVLHERPGHLRLGAGLTASAEALELVPLHATDGGSSSSSCEEAEAEHACSTQHRTGAAAGEEAGGEHEGAARRPGQPFGSSAGKLENLAVADGGHMPHGWEDGVGQDDARCQVEALHAASAGAASAQLPARKGDEWHVSFAPAGATAATDWQSVRLEREAPAAQAPDLDGLIEDRRQRSASLRAGAMDSTSSLAGDAADEKLLQRPQAAPKGLLGGRGGARPLLISLQSNGGTEFQVGASPGADAEQAEPCKGRWAAKLPALPWAQMFNLPVLSAFAGLAVGCTPALKGLLVGPGAPLGFVRDCLDILGASMIPCMMLILGAVLYKGPGRADVSALVIIVVSLARLVLIPLLGAAVVLALRWAGAFAPPDALFTLVLLLGWSTPTAINVQTLATLHQNGEAEVSCLLFWQYVGAILSMPLLLTMFFRLI